MTYEDHYEWAKSELAKIEVNRQKVIQDLAARLDAAGLPLEMIASEIATHLEGYVSGQYVRRVLDKKYKQDSKDRTKEQNTEKPVAQIAVTNNGKNVTQPPPEQPPQDPIKKVPPQEQEEDPKDVEIAFLKSQVEELKDAMDKMGQFKPATAFTEEDKETILVGPKEEYFIDWMRKRDNKISCFFYDAYGIDAFKNRELSQLKNSGVRVFKRLYFEV